MPPTSRAPRSQRITLRVLFAATLALTAVFVARPAGAQRTFSTASGSEIRYLGDTIWRTRDTVVTRLILRGDTAVRTTYRHGIPVGSATFVQRGDDGEEVTITYRADGSADQTGGPRNRVPISLALAERQMLEQAIRNEQMMARMPSDMRQRITPESSPAMPQEYRVSANMIIVQLRDTVRYVRGCAAAPPIDTTMYVLFGADSVQRRSPDPRTFDRHMVSAIRADMSATMTRTQNAARAEPPATPLPSLRRWPCDRR